MNKNMKKLLVSTIAASAIIIAPIAGKADAAGFQPTNTKVVYHYYTISDQSSNWCKDVWNKLNINWKNLSQPNNKVTQSPVVQKPTTAKPEQQQPQKPAQNVQKPAQQPTQAKPQANNQLSQYEQQVVDLTNQERAKNGLAPLKVDVELSKVAREKSRDMAANHYFSHTSPTYGSPFDMMEKFGITYRSAGENIAMGQKTPQEVVNAWMNSEGHRANILNSSYTHIGVGYDANGNYWTQQFIGK